MREINECTAEVFRRSEKRIKERKRNRNRVLGWCIPLCLIITVCSVTVLPAMFSAGSDKVGNEEQFVIDNEADDLSEVSSLDNFSFSLTWGCYGISSYDSVTGELVKTTDATYPENYVTTYQLTNAQKQKIYDLIMNLDVTSYPNSYNPHKDGLASSPSMTLILSVKTGTFQKTITATDIALTYESKNRKGQRFLNVCKVIQDILTETDEWKALPEYEFFYE